VSLAGRKRERLAWINDLIQLAINLLQPRLRIFVRRLRRRPRVFNAVPSKFDGCHIGGAPFVLGDIRCEYTSDFREAARDDAVHPIAKRRV